MNYNGPLYGKCGRRYIPLKLTSCDVDQMEERLKLAEAERELFRKMLLQNNLDDKMQDAFIKSHFKP
jgi:hypothetical protein